MWYLQLLYSDYEFSFVLIAIDALSYAPTNLRKTQEILSFTKKKSKIKRCDLPKFNVLVAR